MINRNALIGQYASIRHNDQGRPAARRQRPERPAHWSAPRRPKAPIFDWRTDANLVKLRDRLKELEGVTSELVGADQSAQTDVERAEQRLTETQALLRLGLATDKDCKSADSNLARAQRAKREAADRVADNAAEIRTLRAIAPQVEDDARLRAQASLKAVYGPAVKRLSDALAAAVLEHDEVMAIFELAGEMFSGGIDPAHARGGVRIPSSGGLFVASWPMQTLDRETYDNWVKARREEGVLP